MRATVLVLCVAGTAAAAPRATMADWVGDYTGKLAWTGCTVPGAKSATVALDSIDGAPAIDLAPAGGGLRAMSLSQDADAETLAARDGDVSLAIGRPRANAIELTIDLASGCRIHGTLLRASVKVAPCDRLLALARIEQRCTKQPDRPAPLAVEKWKAKDAARCTARADEVQARLVDAGCFVPPDPTVGQVGPQCRQLLAEAAQLARCPSLPPDALSGVTTISTLARPASDRASRIVAEDACRQGHELLADLALHYRCPL